MSVNMSMDLFKLGQLLGNAYGSMWTANANKRDDKKIEAIKDSLGNIGPEETNDIVELGPTVGTLDPNTSVADVAQAVNQDAMISGGPQGIAFNKNGGLKGNVQQRVGNINTADVLANGGIAGPENIANTGLSWRPTYSAVDLEKAMKEKGIGKSSRDRALADYKKEIAEQAQKEMLPDIVKAIGSGNTQDALSALMQYRQYDPDTANILAKDYQSAMQYNRQKEMQDRQFANQKELAAINAANRIAYKQAVGGGGGRTSSGITIGDFNFKRGDIKDEVSNLQRQIKDKQKDIDGLDSTSSDYETKKTILTSQRQELEKDLDAIRNVRTNPQGYVQREYDKAKFDFYSNKPMDVNNYSSVKANVDKLIYDEGKPVWEVMEFLKSRMGDGPMYRAIASEYQDEKGRWTLGGLDLDGGM